MRVLVIANNFPTPANGLDGTFVLSQLRALERLGHEFLVVRVLPSAPRWYAAGARYRAVPDRYEAAGLPVRVLRVMALPREYLLASYHRQLYGRIGDLAGEFGAQAVHAQGTLASGFVAAGHGLPVVLTAHGSDTYDAPWRRADLEWAARAAVRGASAWVGVSEFVASFLRRLGAPSTQVVPNGAAAEVFQPILRAQARTDLGLSQESRIVAYVGRLDLQKGLADLVEAASQQAAPALVLFGGDGPARTQLERQCERLGVERRFLGFVTQERLRDVYAAADVIALPSYNEGLPTVLCEAMLMGRAVIASTVGGIPEIVFPERTGLLHDPKDVPALRDALARVLNDSALRDRFEENARTYALERLTWDANARDYDRIYRSL